MAPERISVSVDGHLLSLSNLGKVLYPEVGFTKGEVIDYYSRIGPTMLPHVIDRCVTMKRYPDGVAKASFFNKRCPRPPASVRRCCARARRRRRSH